MLPPTVRIHRAAVIDIIPQLTNVFNHHADAVGVSFAEMPAAQEFMNDLGGPGKTLKQRTVALRRLAYMATLLTMFGLPSDLLDDWISGKDTYIPEHVMNNMLGMFGLSRYTTSRALNKGAVESVIQRFTPPAINIMIDGEQSLRSWVKGDKELFDIKSWRNSPLSDVWYYRTGGGVESQRKYQKKQRKEGITPSIDR